MLLAVSWLEEKASDVVENVNVFSLVLRVW